MASQLFLPKGKNQIIQFKIEKEYLNSCKDMLKLHGKPVFEMSWPNKKIFQVFRDKYDNQIEVQYNPITIGDSKIGEFA